MEPSAGRPQHGEDPAERPEQGESPGRRQQHGESAAADQQHDERPRGLRLRLESFARRFSPTGLVLALTCYCISMTPSLIPRGWLFQGLLTGLSMIAGYAAGAFLGWATRRLGFHARWDASTTRTLWFVLAGLTAVLVPWFLVLASRWQGDLRTLFGIEATPESHVMLVVLLGVGLALVLLLVARGLRWCSRRAGDLLGRWVPARVARLVGAVTVTVVAVLLVNGTLINGAMTALKNISAATDAGTPDGAVEPTSPLRSGSPESVVDWDDLGFQGRGFVSSGPSVEQIVDFAAGGDVVAADDVVEPIRVYAGLQSAEDIDAVAALVVDELDRTDAWDREILVVATTTGTGWVDPSMSQTLEYMHGGDTAIAAMQYSYLPSWVSFLSDRDTPPAAGKALYEAVYDAWLEQPEDSRPFLVAYGLSLGSFGAQGAFSGLQDMTERTQGALFVGTPSFTPNWAYFTKNRDPGSLEYSPVYEGGRQVRFGTEPGSGADVWDIPGTWEEPRVVYLQHASDAVIWWSLDVLWREPDWVSEPGPDRLEMTWVPVVTFWQVTFDMFVAGNVPQGHGHSYHLAYSDGLAALGAPEGWDDTDTARLKELMSGVPDES
ncbi:alpha/beta hydrolase [Sanguibacter inulinus]|uniref:Alpha/beta-hydrolase family protein n=1 Tax=Sanguibacter inulinus TaxID=60922 RepID=A0A853EY56_9MICO|nr:alpha/beta-hydrolase family protein [Sanguibacter inulinus]MBF0722633.1 alpha/beta-hydrolase family protein [Sanguibacter inulinus]NYS93778.1 alpha/beta-hydrolase family protein [Sanguibacter inulinus]